MDVDVVANIFAWQVLRCYLIEMAASSNTLWSKSHTVIVCHQLYTSVHNTVQGECRFYKVDDKENIETQSPTKKDELVVLYIS